MAQGKRPGYIPVGYIFRSPRHKTVYRRFTVRGKDGVERDVFEHRLVAEKMLGRPLLPTEIVHHKDGNGLNNDWSNLEVTNQSDHMREHRIGLKKWRLEDALELRQAGYSLARIAQKLGVSYSSVRKAFIYRNLSTKHQGHNSPK